MDFGIDEEYETIRSEVRRLCDKFGNAYWRGLEPDRYPAEFVDELTRQGWLGALIPEEYGGGALPLAGACVIVEEIAASGGNPSACHAQMYVMGTLLRHGTAEQKQRYLPAIAAGDLRLQAFGVTEPEAGSETARIRTRAVRTDEGWLINGQKIWTSRALYSDLMILLGPNHAVRRGGEEVRRHVGVPDRSTRGKGITIRPIATMMNHNTTEVYFDDVLIPHDALVGTEGMGFRHILDGMNAERLLIASECIGDGRFFLDRAVAYANERQVFGRPIGANQGVQFPLARAYAAPGGSRPDAQERGGAVRRRQAVRHRGESGEDDGAPRRRGQQAMRASTPTAASASPSSTTSSASSARPGCTRWRRSTTTSSWPTSARTCSVYRAATETSAPS